MVGANSYMRDAAAFCFFKSVATATSISYDYRLSEMRSSLWTQLGRLVMDMSSDQQGGLSGQLCDVYL